jgi:hypothetical protein
MHEFDQWREKYDSMTIQEQVEYHNELESRYPEQAHYRYQNIKEVLSVLPDKAKILEFGCWKADLAQEALNDYPSISSWKGIEICKSAIDKTKCNNNKFEYIFPKEFNWFETTIRPNADCIIGTHFIEHLSDNHFESLAKYCKGVKHVIFEAPLKEQNYDWTGYIGTHKLNYGWQEVIRIMFENNFVVRQRFEETIWFETPDEMMPKGIVYKIIDVFNSII